MQEHVSLPLQDVIAWFWAAAEALDDRHRRLLLQFWSGIDGMPVEVRLRSVMRMWQAGAGLCCAV